jgi:uncharacterized glyoxalase superfamily protein PhnB
VLIFGAVGEARSGARAEMKIGDSIVMVSGGGGVRQVFPAFLYVFVEGVDAPYQRAIVSGAQSIEEPKETPYGDRRATVQNQWGNMRQIATHRSASA